MKLSLILLILAIPMSMAYMHDLEMNKVDPEELRLLQILGHTECGICDTMEILKVMSVALRRKADDRFPSTLDSVLTQQNQFAGFNNELDETLIDGKVKYCAEHILTKRKLYVGPTVLGFYHPKKAKNLEWVAKVRDKVVSKMPHHYFHEL